LIISTIVRAKMIVKKSIVLELPKTLEKGTAQRVCPKPYYIERVEDKSGVTWYGYDRNWTKDFGSDQWHCLEGGEFVPCSIPEYEILYLSLREGVLK